MKFIYDKSNCQLYFKVSFAIFLILFNVIYLINTNFIALKKLEIDGMLIEIHNLYICTK